MQIELPKINLVRLSYIGVYNQEDRWSIVFLLFIVIGFVTQRVKTVSLLFAEQVFQFSLVTDAIPIHPIVVLRRAALKN
jgi:hypothetical protein